MGTFETLKNKLIQLNTDFIELVNNTDTNSVIEKDTLKQYETLCTTATKHISEDIVRVAVVGPIKSGKSTFVNSLFQNDYLKRGAGVITSLVTKMRCGDQLKATVSFKAWDEINEDIEQGLSLLPVEQNESETLRFDLRKESHRTILQEALNSLNTEQLIVNDSRNLNTVLLSSYLKGYDQIKDLIAPDSVTKVYENGNFSEHRTFTGDEIMAVYINDVQLEINADIWDRSIEIADCQGSDSPNPLHLAMVQDYLSATNFIVYVISSRTGLRRADIKFLLIIKEMGIIDNILFVINCDFSEHESTEEFNSLIEKTREEISIIIPDPEVFTLSALYNLFSLKKEAENNPAMELSKKDRLRLEQWEGESFFTSLSSSESKKFANVLTSRLTEHRYALLLANHIERLSVITSGIKQRIAVNKELLTRDTKSANTIIARIKTNQEKTSKVSTMIRSTLDGAVKKVNADMKREIDIFFDEKSGFIISEIRKFIRNYEHSFNGDYTAPETNNFANRLYVVFQEFKQTLDTFMAESIAPKIIGFMNQNDKKLIDTLFTMTRPYENMVDDVMTEYSKTLEDFSINVDVSEVKHEKRYPDIDILKTSSGITAPKATTLIKYSTRVKAESIVRLSLYSAAGFFKKLFKKQAVDKNKHEVKALKDGLSLLKKETVANLVTHFLNYKENLKYQYFVKLSNIIADNIYDIHTSSFNAYINDLETISTLINEKKQDKNNVIETLDLLEKGLDSIIEQINGLRQDISDM